MSITVLKGDKKKQNWKHCHSSMRKKPGSAI